MNLHTAQREIVKDPHRFRVVNAGRRFGKSVVGVEELLFTAVTKEASVAYCAPTYLQAREIAWAFLKKRAEDFEIVDINETRLEMSIKNKLGTNSKITLKGWESIEGLRGLSFDFLVLDEVAMYRNFKVGWEEVVRPTLTDRKGKVLFISTPKGFNFWYDLCNLEKEDKDYKTFHFTSFSNPFLPKEELEKMKSEMEENHYAQEILADFKKTEGLIYNFDYDPRFKIEDYDLNQADKTIAGIDWGFVHPAAVTIIKSKGEYVYVVDEWKKSKKTTPEIIQQCKIFDNKHRIRKWYPDPAEQDRIEEAKRAGLFCEETNKDVEFGISVVQGLIKEKRLFIADHCLETLKEFERYQYDEGTESPIKENDDLLDSLRYAIIGGKLAKEDKWKQMYGGIPFRDQTVDIWKGDA